MKSLNALPRAVLWDNRTLRILDQRRMPRDRSLIACHQVEDVFECIQTLAVRGAPAIGIAAAYGLLVDLFETRLPLTQLKQSLSDRAEYLISARPTAVNLSWAVNRMMGVASDKFGDTRELLERLEAEAIAIHQEDIEACHQIGDHGVALVRQYPNVLTHCNAGSLAVSELGTALAPIYRAFEEGVKVHVFVDETRPLLQGARLTAFELQSVGVDCTLITDNMAAHMMASGDVDMVLVGADRIVANGDVANKIGTLNLAVLCQHFNIPFYVACPVSTIDINTESGADIVIEQRNPTEVTHWKGEQISPDNINVANPAFDVTPANLVTGIITEIGIVKPPFDESLRVMEGKT
ncbi:MAG: S-methyl-5-thioribose-1-phosphate isomerase [Gammaproteobacteria bacterium]|nr:S-methyl-5-thioribose-1-phosphate isomerase [Gammaproteobacteria bacterium]